MIESFQKRIAQSERLHIHTHKTGANVLTTAPYAGIIEYRPEELFITVKAGTNMSTIHETLQTERQGLPFFVDDATASIGAAYAIGGAYLSDSVLGIKIIDGRAVVLSFGGQVIKNVAGYDVSRLLVGSLGQYALIVEISFKVLPIDFISDAMLQKTQRKPVTNTHLTIAQKLKSVFDPRGVFI